MTATEAPPEAPKARFGAAFFARFPRAKALLLLAVLIGALNLATVRSVSGVSAIDERFYIDALIKGSRLELDKPGDFFDEESLIELCERHSSTGALHFPACKPGKQNPKKFIPGGVNTVGALPLYFFTTGVAASALRSISPIALPPRDSMVTWGRVLGGAWLLLGCWFALIAADLLGIKRRLVVTAIIAVIGTPALLHGTTIINTDATAFAAGAGVLAAAIAWEQRKVRLWVPIVAALLGAAFKLPNTVGIIVVIAYFAIQAFLQRSGTKSDAPVRPWMDYVKAIAGVGIAAVVAIRGYTFIYDLLKDHNVISKADTNVLKNKGASTQLDTYKVPSVTIGKIFGEGSITRLLPPIDDVAPPPNRIGGIYGAFAIGMKYLLILPLLGLVFFGREFTKRLRVLSLGTLVALLVAPVMFVLYWYVVSGTNDQMVPRYGLSAMPAFVLLVAWASTRGKYGVRLLTFMAVGMYTSAMVTNFI